MAVGSAAWNLNEQGRSRGSVEAFSTTTLDADPDLIEALSVARRPPPSASLSAHLRHELTDEIPATIDLALPRGTRAPTTSARSPGTGLTRRPSDLGREDLDVGAGYPDRPLPAERSMLRRVPPPSPGGQRASDEAAQALVASTRQPAIQLLALPPRWVRRRQNPSARRCRSSCTLTRESDCRRQGVPRPSVKRANGDRGPVDEHLTLYAPEGSRPPQQVTPP